MGAQRLDDLASLSSIEPRLRELRFETCGAIANLGDIAHQTNLRELWLANCGPINSLSPIGALTELGALIAYESTRIADGDLSPLLQLGNLARLRMMNRRHYRPTVAEIKAMLKINE
ncbi:MAG: hypothetical protein ACR2KJ_00295 [Jatrophihabitans sp.]